ncbi:hypothetical protein O3M35_005590 [Rhynocoris fuscipes]|uniref:SP-RING-type domain-containing protein n=1 Tax=Rhynocoris fuscipes TaxID=488301 RepID=A0AAW1DJ72_9HEMI
MEHQLNKRSSYCSNGYVKRKRKYNSNIITYLSRSNLIKMNCERINKAVRETVAFDFIEQIISPTVLTKTSGQSVFEIILDIANANLISLGRDRCVTSSNHLENNYIYNVKMLIRICKIENVFYALDEYPERIAIHVNKCSVNIMKNSLIDVTAYLKINPSIKNIIKISNVLEESKSFYLVTAFLARKSEVKTIIKRLLEKHIRSEEFTKNRIENILKKEKNDLEFTSLEISLKCPLSLTTMRNPCQSYNCSHLDCFETENYIELNMASEKWLCPICKIYAPPKTLVIDGYFLQILKTIPEGCSSLIMSSDGSCIARK